MNDLIRVKGVRKEDARKARELAQKIGSGQARGALGLPLASSIRLLEGLGAQDVPEIASGKQNTPDRYKSDFAFFYSSSETKAILATLSSKYFRACYDFETNGPQIEWHGTLPPKDQKSNKSQFSFLSASPWGDFALMRRSNNDRETLFVDCDRFYDHYFVKKNSDDMPGSSNAVVSANPDALSISNGGQRYAALTAREGGQRGVDIWQLESGKKVFSLVLGDLATQISQGTMNLRMEFNPKATSCTLWLRERDTLLLYRLTDYDLRLLPPLVDPGGIPTTAKSLIVAATVAGALRVRIFDANGNWIEPDMNNSNVQVQALLVNLWPPHELTKREKSQVIGDINSILGYTPNLAPEVIRCPGPVVDCGYSYDGKKLAIASARRLDPHLA